jgi:hypothetical protein
MFFQQPNMTVPAGAGSGDPAREALAGRFLFLQEKRFKHDSSVLELALI